MLLTHGARPHLLLAAQTWTPLLGDTAAHTVVHVETPRLSKSRASAKAACAERSGTNAAVASNAASTDQWASGHGHGLASVSGLSLAVNPRAGRQRSSSLASPRRVRHHC